VILPQRRIRGLAVFPPNLALTGNYRNLKSLSINILVTLVDLDNMADTEKEKVEKYEEKYDLPIFILLLSIFIVLLGILNELSTIVSLLA